MQRELQSGIQRDLPSVGYSLGCWAGSASQAGAEQDGDEIKQGRWGGVWVTHKRHYEQEWGKGGRVHVRGDTCTPGQPPLKASIQVCLHSPRCWAPCLVLTRADPRYPTPGAAAHVGLAHQLMHLCSWSLRLRILILNSEGAQAVSLHGAGCHRVAHAGVILCAGVCVCKRA